jgi:glucosyl-dolichyl phosphate glucuronosyltransferase
VLREIDLLPEEIQGLPFVSVIIPTFNRSRLLRDTVESLLAQSYDRDRFEILVVDNNSTDDTASVIAALASDSPIVRPLVEQRRGAHFARNSGAVAAKGEILYFTDDDMIADPDLLRQLVTAFSSGINVGSATGRVLPRWGAEPPEWVIEHCLNHLLSLNDMGHETTITDVDPGIFSCHQAVLREAFFRAGGFNPDTNAGKFVGDNETGLNIKIGKLGYRFAYVGESVTQHVIPASRMNQRYLNSRFADQGFCDSYTSFRRGVSGTLRLGGALALHAMMIVPSAISAAVLRVRGRSLWRLRLARVFYFRNRAIYDARLLASRQWRQFALRDDWISDG